MSDLVAFWAGVTVAAWAVIRIRKAWGAVFHYHGWEWFAVPFYLAQGVWRTRKVPETYATLDPTHPM